MPLKCLAPRPVRHVGTNRFRGLWAKSSLGNQTQVEDLTNHELKNRLGVEMFHDSMSVLKNADQANDTLYLLLFRKWEMVMGLHNHKWYSANHSSRRSVCCRLSNALSLPAADSPTSRGLRTSLPLPHSPPMSDSLR